MQPNHIGDVFAHPIAKRALAVAISVVAVGFIVKVNVDNARHADQVSKIRKALVLKQQTCGDESDVTQWIADSCAVATVSLLLDVATADHDADGCPGPRQDMEAALLEEVNADRQLHQGMAISGGEAGAAVVDALDSHDHAVSQFAAAAKRYADCMSG